MSPLPFKNLGGPDGSHSALFFARLMELLPDHVYFKDLEGRFFCINRAQAEFFGLANPDEAVGKTDYDFFPEEFAHQKDEDEREIVRTGVGFVGKEERNDRDGRERWSLSTKLPLYSETGEPVGTFGISRDVTDTKFAHEALEAQHRLLQTLIDILPCRIFVKDQTGRFTITNQAYRRYLGFEKPEEVEGRRRDEIVSDSHDARVAADDLQVLQSGSSILNREDLDQSPSGERKWMLLSKVPLVDREGRVQGIVGMSADITAQKLAEERAVRAQRELEVRTRVMESELAMAREMQQELMTASVQTVKDSLSGSARLNADIAFAYEPCAHLAGDFFQLLNLAPTRFGLLVGDVMGHGVKAALVTTLLRGLLAEVTAHTVHPSEVIAALNDRLCGLLDRPSFPRFVTALYATIDLHEGMITVANAAHPWPLLRRQGNPAGPLVSAECGPGLGLIPGATYEAVSLSLNAGDRLLFYTDGLKEEQNWAGEEFGPERLARTLDSMDSQGLQVSLQSILSQVRGFSGSAASGDDLCAILLGL